MNSMINLPIPHPRSCPSWWHARLCKSLIKDLDQMIITGDGTEELRKKRDNCASYIAPFRCLSDELLRNIFDLSLHCGVNIITLTHICGRFRDIIIENASIWSNINLPSTQSFSFLSQPRQENILETGIRCMSKEQLQVMLARGRSEPLKLHIEWPLEKERLKAALSTSRKVSSLVINAAHTPQPCNPEEFSALDLSSLRELDVAVSDQKTLEGFMDLALRSTIREMTLSVEVGRLFVDRFLKHRLMERIIDLTVDTSGLCAESPLGNWTSVLPYVKKCRIVNAIKLIQRIRFAALEKLQIFTFGSLHRPLNLSSIPTTLTELAMREVSLDPRNQQCRLPNLDTLKITNSIVEGHLEDHFDLPSLKRLYLTEILFVNSLPGKSMIPKKWSLEHLTIQKLYVDEELAERARSWPRLQSLRLIQSKIFWFLHVLNSSLGHKSSFKSLRSLHIEDSWPQEDEYDFDSLVEMCANSRPEIQVSGNGNQYDEDHDSEPSYDSDTALY